MTQSIAVTEESLPPSFVTKLPGSTTLVSFLFHMRVSALSVKARTGLVSSTVGL